MKKHPLSERLRAQTRADIQAGNPGYYERAKVANECADALDAAATALAACVRAMTVATEDGGEAWNDALALARAALPAERDEKETA